MIAETLAVHAAANYTFIPNVPVGSIIFYPNWQFYLYVGGVSILAFIIGMALMFVAIHKIYRLERKSPGEKIDGN